jgi:hypothetical protein
MISNVEYWTQEFILFSSIKFEFISNLLINL